MPRAVAQAGLWVLTLDAVVEPGKMKLTLSLLLVFLRQFMMPRHNAQLRRLKTEIAILRARIANQRIIL